MRLEQPLAACQAAPAGATCRGHRVGWWRPRPAATPSGPRRPSPPGPAPRGPPPGGAAPPGSRVQQLAGQPSSRSQRSHTLRSGPGRPAGTHPSSPRERPSRGAASAPAALREPLAARLQVGAQVGRGEPLPWEAGSASLCAPPTAAARARRRPRPRRRPPRRPRRRRRPPRRRRGRRRRGGAEALQGPRACPGRAPLPKPPRRLPPADRGLRQVREGGLRLLPRPVAGEHHVAHPAGAGCPRSLGKEQGGLLLLLLRCLPRLRDCQGAGASGTQPRHAGGRRTEEQPEPGPRPHVRSLLQWLPGKKKGGGGGRGLWQDGHAT